MKGSAGIENHPVGGITLITKDDEIIVLFEYEGKWYEAIREVNDGGPVNHTLHANGIRSLIAKGKSING